MPAHYARGALAGCAPTPAPCHPHRSRPGPHRHHHGPPETPPARPAVRECEHRRHPHPHRRPNHRIPADGHRPRGIHQLARYLDSRRHRASIRCSRRTTYTNTTNAKPATNATATANTDTSDQTPCQLHPRVRAWLNLRSCPQSTCRASTSRSRLNNSLARRALHRMVIAHYLDRAAFRSSCGNRSENPCWPERTELVDARGAQRSIMWENKSQQPTGQLHGLAERLRARCCRSSTLRRRVAGQSTSPVAVTTTP